MILRFLIPVEMLYGRMPSEQFLKEKGLENEYAIISRAVVNGDINSYEKCLDENMEGYLTTGVYLTLDKLRFLIYRTLIKKLAIA